MTGLAPFGEHESCSPTFEVVLQRTLCVLFTKCRAGVSVNDSSCTELLGKLCGKPQNGKNDTSETYEEHS